MSRLLPSLPALAMFFVVADANAQGYAQIRIGNGYSPSLHIRSHRSLYRGSNGLDVVKLDAYADQLAQVARHLHEDAHSLSPNCVHSRSIELYVDRIDRLQHHMHDLLHDAAASGRYSSSLNRHIQTDVQQVRALFTHLYGELQHLEIDGVRSRDNYTIGHMLRIMTTEAFPLLRRMETLLDDCLHDVHRAESHRWPTTQQNWARQRTRVHRW